MAVRAIDRLKKAANLEAAKKTLSHQVVDDYVRLEIQADVVAKPKPKAKKANVKKESD